MECTRVERLEGRLLLSASLIKDLNLNTSDSDPVGFAALNGVVYFSAAGSLYRTNGTSAGTLAVAGGQPNPTELTTLGNQIFFASSGGLWRIDGTSGAVSFLGAGPLTPGLASTAHDEGPGTDNPRDLTVVGSTLYFAKGAAGSAGVLWQSNGTAAGTVPVAAAAGLTNPDSLTNVNGTLFFHANDGLHGDELWKTNGTAAGTVLVKDIFPGATGSSLGSFTAVGGSLYFTADDGDHGLELWKSDGTAAGTVMLKDIDPGPMGSAPSQLTNVNGTIYFVANDGTTGYELWKSDGTAAGTVLVSNIDPGATGGGIGDLTAAGTSLYFTAQTPAAGTELWATSGTAAGTHMVRDINPGFASSLPSSLLYANSTLYFRADDGVHGGEMWKSNGTAAGTVLVKDIYPGANGSGASGFAYLAGAIYFSANDLTHGTELWKSDGTTSGTALVRDINTRPAGSSTGPVVQYGTLGFFSGNDGIHGQELWETDGTAAGTMMVADIAPGAASSSPTELTAAYNGLYFVAAGRLYKTDGTAAGTVQVNGVSNPASLTSINGLLAFTGSDSNGLGLWLTDGTAQGTTLLRYFTAPGIAVDDLTKVESTLYFAADDGINGTELWRSDLTPAGTVMVDDINPGAAGSGPWDITDVNGLAFFIANDGVHGYELWVSDGTAQGTAMAADINPGAGDAQIQSLVYFDGVAIFSANDGTSGQELWRSDGTPQGTYLLADIEPGPAGSSPVDLTVAGGYLYFRATGPDGPRLWRADGFGDTVEVPDTNPSVMLSTPTDLTVLGPYLTFVAHAQGQWQVYVTDGTVAAPLTSANAADPYRNPTNLGSMNQTLFFTADNTAHGPTLWEADLSDGVFSLAVPAGPSPKAAPSAAPSTSLAPAADATDPPPAQVPSLVTGAFAYDSTIFADEPVVADAQMPRVLVAYSSDIYLGDYPDASAPDPTMIRTVADRAAALNQPLVIDLETNSDDARFASQGQVNATLQQLIEVADLVHQEQPGVKVGFFGNLPPPYYSGEPLPNAGSVQFEQAVQQMLPLLSHVDFVCPAVYSPAEDEAAFVLSEQVAIDAVVQLGKPVLPFFSMTYQGQDPDLVGRPLPAEVWQDQLTLAASQQVTPILWGGWPASWDGNAAWWAVTREQAAENESPNATFTPDAPLSQPAVTVNQFTINFGVSVTGFSMADLSLTKNGGPNLLGRGVSLSTSDHAKWTLSNLAPITSAGGNFVLTLRNSSAIRSAAGYALLSGKTLSWTTPQVVGRYIFYNNSVFDGNNTAMTTADDSAIATDKQALLPGQRATFANYTSYSRGINGISIDIAGLAGVPNIDDFVFRQGNDNNPAGWGLSSLPVGPWVRPAAGVNGSTRIEFVWPDNWIQNTWMQITVKANADTGLSTPDVFYFGNAIGESGNLPLANAIVDGSDVTATQQDPDTAPGSAPVTNPHDYNRDGRVDFNDVLTVVEHQTTAATALNLIGYATFSDVLLIAQYYGGYGTRAQGDFTGDGLVNFNDLLFVAQNYGPAFAPTVLPAAASSPDDLVLVRKSRPAVRQPAPAGTSQAAALQQGFLSAFMQ